jgi:hypothetical protein
MKFQYPSQLTTCKELTSDHREIRFPWGETPARDSMKGTRTHGLAMLLVDRS